jgi:molecular chaperone GrpE
MADEHEDFELDKENLDDSVLEEEYSADKVKKLKEKLKVAEAKAKEYLDGWQRCQAEAVNARKRDEEGRAEFAKFAKADTIEQLMPVLDSLELSLPHGNKELEAVYKQLMQILKANGLEEDNPKGKPFDPRQHESIGIVATNDEGEDGKILEVLQKGYILQGRIIRPAKVRVGEFNN